MKTLVALIVALTLVVGNATAFHEEKGLEVCEAGSFGYFTIVGSDQDGFAIVLTERPVYADDKNKVKVICIVAANDLIFVMDRPKEVRGGMDGKVYADTRDRRGASVQVFQVP